MNQKKDSYLPLCEYVDEVLNKYFTSLDGHVPADLYQMVIEQVELPLLRRVMKYVANNQSKAATILSISRGTLRKKLKQYKLEC